MAYLFTIDIIVNRGSHWLPAVVWLAMVIRGQTWLARTTRNDNLGQFRSKSAILAEIGRKKAAKVFA